MNPLDLNLDRPLLVFDIESTGVNWRVDRIIDLAWVKVLPDGQRASGGYRVHPGVPIPSESTRIHGITDEDVKDCPPFSEIARAVAEDFADADLGGYNLLRFDLPLLGEEFKRAEVPFDLSGRRIVDAQRIYHQREPRDLSAALRFYAGESHTGAHGAMEDALATVRVIEGQLQRYPDLPRDLDALHAYCNPRDDAWVDAMGRLKWSDGEIVINFGRNQGRRLRDLLQKEPGFIQWILNNSFPEDTKTILRNAQSGEWPTPPGG